MSSFTVKTSQSQAKSLQGKIIGHPTTATKYYFQKLQTVSAEAADIGRQYMNERPNWTPTGERRKAAGGNGPGRVDTGTMQSRFKSDKGKKVSDTKYELNFGWLNDPEPYFFFQEHGTKNGIVGMEALNYAKEWARTMIKDLGAKNGTSVRSTKAAPFEGEE